MKLYIAGPMRGYAEFNHPAFHKAAGLLRADGHEVFCPAEYDNDNGFDFTDATGSPEDLVKAGFDLRIALATDLRWICEKASGVTVLPGWEASLGANAEVATAHALSLPVWEVGALLVHGAEALRVTAGAS